MQTLGRYEILKAISRGGMGEVWLGRSPHGRFVAIKLAHDETSGLRLREEAALGARVYHPNLVETIEFFEHVGRPVLVTGFIDGMPVGKFVEDQPLSEGATARLGRQTAEALAALHSAIGDDNKPLNAVHRDLSVNNVMVTRDGNAMLIDLGISRSALRNTMTATGTIIGTVRYMAPELLDGADATVASDLWALGVMLTEMCLCLPVFDGVTSQVITGIHRFDPTTNPVVAQLPGNLRAVVQRCMAVDPGMRFQNANEVARFLRPLEQGEPERVDTAARATRLLGPPPDGVAVSATPAQLPVAVSLELAAPPKVAQDQAQAYVSQSGPNAPLNVARVHGDLELSQPVSRSIGSVATALAAENPNALRQGDHVVQPPQGPKIKRPKKRRSSAGFAIAAVAVLLIGGGVAFSMVGANAGDFLNSVEEELSAAAKAARANGATGDNVTIGGDADDVDSDVAANNIVEPRQGGAKPTNKATPKSGAKINVSYEKPNCYSGRKGEFFAIDDKRGHTNVYTNYKDIPPAEVARVRCVVTDDDKKSSGKAPPRR